MQTPVVPQGHLFPCLSKLLMLTLVYWLIIIVLVLEVVLDQASRELSTDFEESHLI